MYYNHGVFGKAKNDVQLPKRQTKGSAGYDFYAPISIEIGCGEKVSFDTGVIANVPDGYVLLLFPRSGLGSKGLVLTNTVGVIDSDYNKEIKALLSNNNKYNSIRIEKGERYMQGVFVRFNIFDDEEVTEERDGGFGSTGR